MITITIYIFLMITITIYIFLMITITIYIFVMITITIARKCVIDCDCNCNLPQPCGGVRMYAVCETFAFRRILYKLYHLVYKR